MSNKPLKDRANFSNHLRSLISSGSNPYWLTKEATRTLFVDLVVGLIYLDKWLGLPVRLWICFLEAVVPLMTIMVKSLKVLQGKID